MHIYINTFLLIQNVAVSYSQHARPCVSWIKCICLPRFLGQKKSPPPSLNILAEACQQLSKPDSTPPPPNKTTLVKTTEISWLPSQCPMSGIFPPLSSLSFKHRLHDMRRRHDLNVNTKLCDDVSETLQHAFSMISLPSEVR